MITPPEPWLDVTIKVRPNGRAPAKYGSGVYRFEEQPARLLKSRNWDEVGHSSKYTYLVFSNGDAGDPPFAMSVRIPEQDQAIAFAQELNDAGKRWTGRIGEWDAAYRPVEAFSISYQQMDPFTAMPIGSPTPGRSSTIVPFFVVGSPGLWSMTIRLWKDGPSCDEESRHIIARGPTLFDRPENSPTRTRERAVPEDLYEGALERVAANRYERSKGARKVCIIHYGAVCSVCGFDFGLTYGDVARGFIHVHHILPLSSVGKGYKVDPIKDLRPVCPNCHVVLHLSDLPRTIDEAKALLKRT